MKTKIKIQGGILRSREKRGGFNPEKVPFVPEEKWAFRSRGEYDFFPIQGGMFCFSIQGWMLPFDLILQDIY